MLNVYPIIKYENNIITDISRRFLIESFQNKNKEDIYFDYTIKNWRSPENIAYDFYGSCDYIWIIMIINDIVDPINDWLLKDDELKNKIITKYGLKNIYNIHHYELNGILYRNYQIGCKEITNFEYEFELNEEKRIVKIVYPELVSSIEQKVKKEFI